MWKAMATLLGLVLLVVCLPLSLQTALAQEEEVAPQTEAEPVALYRLDFVVRELENGTSLNTRNYRMLLEEKGFGRVRAGSKVAVPIPAGGVQYIDVGVRIDCGLKQRRNSLALDITFEIDDFVSPKQGAGLQNLPATIREIRSKVMTAIQPGETAVITSIDDTGSKRRYELEVTATKIR